MKTKRLLFILSLLPCILAFNEQMDEPQRWYINLIGLIFIMFHVLWPTTESGKRFYDKYINNWTNLKKLE